MFLALIAFMSKVALKEELLHFHHSAAASNWIPLNLQISHVHKIPY